MRFADPWFLSLVFLAIPIALFGRKGGSRVRYSSVQRLKVFRSQAGFNPRHILVLFRALALVLFVLAVARPQSGKRFSEVTSEGVDITLALDTSGSMEALDFKLGGKPVTRLDVVKKVASDFVKGRAGDRIAIVVFGEEAYTQCPLTMDHGIVVDFLSRLQIGMAGDATAIGSGLGTAINRMKDLKAKSKVVVLMTDGSSNAGRMAPEKAAELAQTFGIKVYTIGIGTKGSAPFLRNTPLGPQYIYQKVDIDEVTLTKIAEKTNARYFRATGTEELSEIYNEIDRLEKSEVKIKEYTEYYERYGWFVLIGLAFILLEVILAHTRLRKIP